MVVEDVGKYQILRSILRVDFLSGGYSRCELEEALSIPN